MSGHSITVQADGTLQFVWSDDLAPLLGLGASDVRRASHVEPDGCGGWIVDLSPMGGPVMGPFHLRGPALEAEREWIENHLAGATQ